VRVYVSKVSGQRLTARVLSLAPLVLALLVACGERAGDAVVALSDDRTAEGGEPSPPGGASARGGSESTSGNAAGGGGSGNTSGNTAGGGSGGAAGSGPTPSVGPSGLCAPCASSSECGDANDACIVHDDERFCGRDCDGPQDCPDGYSCVELSNSQLLQCVPDTSCVVPSAAPPSLEEGRRYVLTRINAERAAASREPLEASDCLDEIAQQSALDFARTDEPLGKYVKECDPVWPNCACGWWAEGEVTVARYGLDWQTAVDAALSASTVGGERFAQAYLSTAVKDVGIGFWLSGDEAWIALSFR
jgi:hypothetical protein